MSAIEHARAIYKDAAEASDRQSLDSFTSELQQRARQIREGQRDNVRGNVAAALSRAQPEEQEEVADQLEETSETLENVFGKAAPTVQKLSDDTAAEAVQASSEMHVDPLKLARGAEQIVDPGMAEDIRDHELEHNHQSGHADAATISLDRKAWKADDVYEIAAVSVQKRVDFLSDEYRGFAQVTMDEQDRSLVRAGKFRDLEAKKNGEALAA